MQTIHKLTLGTLMLGGLLSSASAINYIIDETAGDCAILGGTWDNPVRTCRINTLSIAQTDSLELISISGAAVRLLILGSLENRGSLAVNNNTTLSNVGDLINVGLLDNTGTVDNDGDLANNAILDNDGILLNTGILRNAGEITNTATCPFAPCDSSPRFQNDASVVNTGVFTNRDQGSFFNSQSFQNNGVFVNASGTSTNQASGDFSNGDSLTPVDGLMEITDGEFINQGTLWQEADSALINDSTLINEAGGFINLADASILENYWFVENHQGSILKITDEARLVNHHHVYNDQSATILGELGGQFQNRVFLANKGEVTISGGASRLINQTTSKLYNFCSGIIVAPAGGFRNDGRLDNFSGTLPALIGGAGPVNNWPFCWDPLFPWEK